MTPDPRTVHVRHGEIKSSESWVYAWVEPSSALVLYVGSTGMNPELRSWLHVHDGDPSVGRILARRPTAREEDFDVLAFPVPLNISRAFVKDLLIQRLSESAQLSADYVGDAPQVNEFGPEISDFVEAMLGFIMHR